MQLPDFDSKRLQQSVQIEYFTFNGRVDNQHQGCAGKVISRYSPQMAIAVMEDTQSDPVQEVDQVDQEDDWEDQ